MQIAVEKVYLEIHESVIKHISVYSSFIPSSLVFTTPRQ